MKVEFLAEGSPDCPLIRLYDYHSGELERLSAACRELVEGRRNEFLLHEQEWVESIGGCRFTWRSALRDVGVRLPAAGDHFVLEFSDEAWREVEDKLRPLQDGSGGFQWLTNEGDVEVLISLGGGW